MSLAITKYEFGRQIKNNIREDLFEVVFWKSRFYHFGSNEYSCFFRNSTSPVSIITVGKDKIPSTQDSCCWHSLNSGKCVVDVGCVKLF